MSRLDGLAAVAAAEHQPDDVRGGCTCGFCAWSAEHVVVMVVRELEPGIRLEARPIAREAQRLARRDAFAEALDVVEGVGNREEAMALRAYIANGEGLS